MEILKKFFKSESTAHNLNYSATRKIQVCIQSIFPINLAIRLTAVDHDCRVEFSKESWNMIVQKAGEIKSFMNSYTEQTIFVNNELKVFTEQMHGKCAVCFLDQRGVRINIMIKTFKKMISLSSELSAAYRAHYKTIKEMAQNLKSLIDFVSVQHNNCDVNNRQFNRFIVDLQQNINTLFAVQESLLSGTMLNSPDSYDDEHDYDDDDEYGRHNTCYYCGRRSRW